MIQFQVLYPAEMINKEDQYDDIECSILGHKNSEYVYKLDKENMR